MPEVYRGRVFSVEVDRLRFPDGKEHQVEVVRHRPSVVLIPMPGLNTVILVRQYRASIGRLTWELPAGSLNDGETADQAAVRECEEEIAMIPRRLVRIRGLFPAPGFCDEELIFYQLSGLEPPPPDSTVRPDEDEDITAQPFDIAAARDMVARGEIVDLKTAYGLTLIGSRPLYRRHAPAVLERSRCRSGESRRPRAHQLRAPVRRLKAPAANRRDRRLRGTRA
jgi:ADP-ribose pyrophosphatase